MPMFSVGISWLTYGSITTEAADKYAAMTKVENALSDENGKANRIARDCYQDEEKLIAETVEQVGDDELEELDI